MNEQARPLATRRDAAAQSGTHSSAAARSAPACTLVIFGAAGDLTKRLLIPALYDLAGAHAVDPLLKAWAQGAPQIYPSGSAGPLSADELLARDGRRWLPLDKT